MSDSSDDMEFEHGGSFADSEIDYNHLLNHRDTLLKDVNAALVYCNGYTTEMWAARIVGILLHCDFRDATENLKTYLLSNKV